MRSKWLYWTVAFTCAPAFAASTVYKDRAAYNAASGAQTVIDFNNQAFPTQLGSSPIAFGNLSLSSTASSSFVIGSAYTSIDGSTFLYTSVSTNLQGLTLSFSTPVYSFGFDTNSLNQENQIVIIGDTTIPLVGRDQYDGFIGLSSDQAFTSASIKFNRGGSASNDLYGIDNLTFSSAPSAAPEMDSWAMMIGGFGMVGTAMRRRKVATSFA